MAITPTDLTDDRIYQRSYGTTAKTITFAGSYDEPTAATVEVKIVRDGTSTIVQDWTALSSATVGGGTYSGSLSVPSQDYMYNYLARIKDSGGTVLATSTQTSNSWGVGVLFGCTGQSNMEKMFSVSSTPPTPDSTVRKYQAGWGAVTGNGAIRLANLLHAIYGCPVGLLNNGINDTGLVYNAGSGIWQAGSSPYDDFLTAISAVGGDLEGVFQHQGEADMKGLTSKAAYKAQLAIEYAGFCAAVTRTTNLLFGIAITGPFQHASATDASCSAIRDGQAEYALGVGGNVFISGNSIDMVRDVGDNAHWTAPYYERMAYRYAQSIHQKIGTTGYNGNGPRILRVVKSPDGIIKVRPNMNYHNSLTELDGSTDGASLTGWEVSDDDFATTLTIDSTEFVGNEIWLHTSGGDATAQHKVRYLYGDEPNITNTVHGNLIPSGDTIGGSMLPVPATVVTAERIPFRPRTRPQISDLYGD